MNHDLCPVDAGAGQVSLPGDAMKKLVLISMKVSEVPEGGFDTGNVAPGFIKEWAPIFQIIPGPVLDKEMLPIYGFFHDDGGALLDEDEYVLIGIRACLPVPFDPDNPGHAMKEEDVPWLPKWRTLMKKYDGEFATACLDNESMHRFLPPGSTPSDYARGAFVDPTPVNGSTEAVGYWCHLPPNMQDFLKNATSVDISMDSLAHYWYIFGRNIQLSDKKVGVGEYQQSRRAVDACYILAADHLVGGKEKEAVYLQFYAGFLMECLECGNDHIRSYVTENPSPCATSLAARFINFHKSIEVTKSMATMFAHLSCMKCYVHNDASVMLASLLDKLQERHESVSECSLPFHSIQLLPFDNSAIMNIVLVNGFDGNDCERATYRNTSLGWIVKTHSIRHKCISGDSARDVSTKFFRISHNGNAIFLSSSGKKTLAELGIVDGDEIVIRDTSLNEVEPSGVLVKAGKGCSRSNKPKKKQGKKKKTRAQKPATYLSEEEDAEKSKLLHSQALSYVFDEMRPQLKKIRNRLNDLTLQKSAPKSKDGAVKKEEVMAPLSLGSPQPDHIGGKAGKVFYPILVGEPENLYKPFKSLDKQTKTIDLHGCSQKEALEKLDSLLPIWLESAMTAEYPFIIAVDIICGGGSQILSDSVAHWIRNNRNVANRPKMR